MVSNKHWYSFHRRLGQQWDLGDDEECMLFHLRQRNSEYAFALYSKGCPAILKYTFFSATLSSWTLFRNFLFLTFFPLLFHFQEVPVVTKITHSFSLLSLLNPHTGSRNSRHGYSDWFLLLSCSCQATGKRVNDNTVGCSSNYSLAAWWIASENTL